MDGVTLALHGPRDAVSAVDLSAPDAAVRRASEALFWAAALDEQSDPGRRHPLAPATAMARNAVAHGVIICARVQEGRTWPARWPLRWFSLRWATTDDVLAGLSKRPKATTIALYDSTMSWMDIEVTLADLLSWYEARATVPPQPHGSM